MGFLKSSKDAITQLEIQWEGKMGFSALLIVSDTFLIVEIAKLALLQGYQAIARGEQRQCLSLC